MAFPRPQPDRTCLVTGASSGIGVELARQLATRRLGVTLVARRADALAELGAELEADHGVRVEVLPADLTDPVARRALVGQLAERGLAVDVLVNNAGFSTWGPVASADRERELTLVRTDVEAVVDLCTLFVPGMVERGTGAVLNVASTASFQPTPGQAAYGAAKAFVRSYSEALGAELHGLGVTVTALCPGPVDTGFAAAAGITTEQFSDYLPRFMWRTAADVAAQGVAGLVKGKAVVVPGLANAVGAGLVRFAPPRAVVAVLARQHPALHPPGAPESTGPEAH
jgi:short-subunit dehydrogenase